MIRADFNMNWQFLSNDGIAMQSMLGDIGETGAKLVNLPHDAMIKEGKSRLSRSQGQTGFYPGGKYIYKKHFYVPKEWEDKTVTFEFEAVYMNAVIYINGCFAGSHPYGYNNFYISGEDHIHFGSDNEIKVVINNSAEENSRWYSGSGMLGNVKLIVANRIRIGLDSVKITTAQAEKEAAVVNLELTVENLSSGRKITELKAVLRDDLGRAAAMESILVTAYAGSRQTVRSRLTVRNPRLWSTDSPDLYQCELTLAEMKEEAEQVSILDEETISFGIRQLQLDAVYGLRINGKQMKLRGACIHHDHGIVGALLCRSTEERKVRKLKEAGFNCIRMGHTPAGKALLDACDKYGMLMMDELTDMWYQPKNTNDFSNYFHDWWEREVESLVKKDRNHPCVILYSTGNELPEAGTAKGAELNRKINDKIKSLDSTRFTINAMNGILAGMDVIGEILSEITPEQKKDEHNAEDAGSNVLNMLLTTLAGPVGDQVNCHPKMSSKLREFTETMDVIGLNYATARHELEANLHPNRLLIATETYPSEVFQVWDSVKRNTNVLGEMTWTGYDYLGEAGIGIMYYDGTMNFSSHWPDSIAYAGDLDITGYRRPISYYREVVYGLLKEPYLAVERMNRHGQACNKTKWAFKDNIASWTWPGYEGKCTSVDIYSKAEEVELFLNGVSLGRRKNGHENQYITTYEVEYAPGTLTAAAYDQGQLTGERQLITAGDVSELVAETEKDMLQANELAFIEVELADCNHIRNRNVIKEIKVLLEGDGTLEGVGSADPQTIHEYTESTWPTYDGRLLIAVRAGNPGGRIQIILEAEGCINRKIELLIEDGIAVQKDEK